MLVVIVAAVVVLVGVLVIVTLVAAVVAAFAIALVVFVVAPLLGTGTSINTKKNDNSKHISMSIIRSSISYSNSSRCSNSSGSNIAFFFCTLLLLHPLGGIVLIDVLTP